MTRNINFPNSRIFPIPHRYFFKNKDFLQIFNEPKNLIVSKFLRDNFMMMARSQEFLYTRVRQTSESRQV